MQKNRDSIEGKAIPLPSLRRLPRYLNYLKELAQKGNVMISASKMADDLELVSTQVRKDLAFTGIQGTPKVGHQVLELIDAIETLLGWHNKTDAFLVGAGMMGKALLGYQGFKKSGVHIVCAFDERADVVGETFNNITILDLDQFKKLVQRMHIKIGIITVPQERAQEVANLMIDSGIAAIWNFAPIRLEVPDHIIVESADLYSSLAVLSHRLSSLK